MTSQIVVLNKKRSFALSESTLILDGFKSYDGEEKIFKISDKLSTALLISGNGRFDNEKLQNHILKFLAKTNIDNITSVKGIKNSFNKFIHESCSKMDVDDYIRDTFPNYEQKIKSINDQSELIEFLKENSLKENIEVLEDNGLLNNLLLKLFHSLSINKKSIKFNEIKFYLKRCYYNYLINFSTNIVIVGYDEENENPTFIKYAILFNNYNNLEIYNQYSLYDYKGTMIFTIAQNQDVNLNLTGFNDNSYYKIQKIVSELSYQFIEDCNEEILNSIKQQLENKITEIKLENISIIIEYIEFLPDGEILKLLDVLIELTSIKKKFSKESHSVGGKMIKAILRKYDGVKFIK